MVGKSLMAIVIISHQHRHGYHGVVHSQSARNSTPAQTCLPSLQSMRTCLLETTPLEQHSGLVDTGKSSNSFYSVMGSDVLIPKSLLVLYTRVFNFASKFMDQAYLFFAAVY